MCLSFELLDIDSVAESLTRTPTAFHTKALHFACQAADLSCRLNNSVGGDHVPVLALFLPMLAVR